MTTEKEENKTLSGKSPLLKRYTQKQQKYTQQGVYIYPYMQYAPMYVIYTLKKYMHIHTYLSMCIYTHPSIYKEQKSINLRLGAWKGLGVREGSWEGLGRERKE